jgi:hypothetical protein
LQYLKILSQGWESPTLSNATVERSQTNIVPESRVDYLWDHPSGNKDKNMWQNVEYVNSYKLIVLK